MRVFEIRDFDRAHIINDRHVAKLKSGTSYNWRQEKIGRHASIGSPRFSERQKLQTGHVSTMIDNKNRFVNIERTLNAVTVSVLLLTHDLGAEGDIIPYVIISQ